MGNNTSNENNVKDLKLESRVPNLSQFQGFLVGLCVGDALGFLMEGTSPSESNDFVENEIRASLNNGKIEESILLRSKNKSMNLGQYSDDGQMSREMMQSYIEMNGFDIEDYSKRIANLIKESRIMGCGLATAKAVARLNRGVSWKESGMKKGDAGNGTAIRSGPMGLFFDSFQESIILIQNSINQSIFTHQDQRCSAGSIVIATSVSFVLRKKNFSSSQMLSHIVDVLKLASSSSVSPSLEDSVISTYTSYLRNMNDHYLHLSPQKAAKVISKLGQDFDDGSIGISGFVTSSVMWSLYCFLKSPNDYMTTVMTAISSGGDTDSTAAMAGCISGCYLGIEKIPGIFSSIVNDRGSYSYKELITIATKCHHITFNQNSEDTKKESS